MGDPGCGIYHHIKQISLGGFFTVLFENGIVSLFGDNRNGQCNYQQNDFERVQHVSCGIVTTGMLMSDNSVLLIGNTTNKYYD